MSGQKRYHEDDNGRFAGNSEFTQVKKTRVVVDSNYLAFANTLNTRLDTLTRKIEHVLNKLNTRLGNLETTIQNLSSAMEAMQVSVCDTVSMVMANGSGAMAIGSPAIQMETGSPMDINCDNAQSMQTNYYA